MRLTLPETGLVAPLRAGLPPHWRHRARVAGLALAGLGLLALLAVSQPRTGFGRLLMGLGLPGLAAHVLDVVALPVTFPTHMVLLVRSCGPVSAPAGVSG